MSDDLFEITCWCRPKDVPEDASEWDVRIWMSKVTPSAVVDGRYVPGKPLIPCPECGKVDGMRISSGWHPG